MNLQNHQQLLNTNRKLALIEEQILKAKQRPVTPENLESLHALASMANQLREEVIRYQAANPSRRAG